MHLVYASWLQEFFSLMQATDPDLDYKLLHSYKIPPSTGSLWPSLQSGFSLHTVNMLNIQCSTS